VAPASASPLIEARTSPPEVATFTRMRRLCHVAGDQLTLRAVVWPFEQDPLQYFTPALPTPLLIDAVTIGGPIVPSYAFSWKKCVKREVPRKDELVRHSLL
jgi:hypothetical protein